MALLVSLQQLNHGYRVERAGFDNRFGCFIKSEKVKYISRINNRMVSNGLHVHEGFEYCLGEIVVM